MALAAATRLGPYEIRGLLGAGGMGEVYRALDPRLGREVAVKVLPEEVGRDPERLARFEREARAVAALNHPNILTVHDVGSHEGTPYVVTELLDGETLRELLSRRAPTQRQVLSLGAQAARGLEAAHAKGILHRDLKPENLFVTTDGRAGQGYDWGVLSLAFTSGGRLLAGGSGGVRWIDLETGAPDWIWRLPNESFAQFALSADGRRLVAASSDVQEVAGASTRWEVVFVDLVRAERHAIRSHGDWVTAAGMDAFGRTLVTGDVEGVVRVGLADGSEPHRLCCHAGKVRTVAVSPDGKWVASAAGSEIRLWPMPDVTKPPLHTLPYDELMAKLRALTNLQVVEDAASPTGYKLDIGPFPGWKDVPTW